MKKNAFFTFIFTITATLCASDTDLPWQPLERHAIFSITNFQEIIQLDEKYNIVEPENDHNQTKPETESIKQPPKPIAVEPISETRTKTTLPSALIRATQEPADFQSTKLRLEKNISIDLSDITLAEAIDYIAENAQVSILTNWNELELLSVSRDDIIDLTNIQKISAGKALETVLLYISPGANTNIGYKIDEEGIVYVKQVQPDHFYQFKTYYIGDLVRPINNIQNNANNRNQQNNRRQNNNQQSSQQNNRW